MPTKKYKFIDLFASIGEFHEALYWVDGRCVCQKVRQKNVKKQNGKCYGSI